MLIHSIFESISGEVGVNIPQGLYCTFIRLQGCNLRCKWCDTKITQYFGGGQEISIEEIVEQVHTTGVVITGGEPLMQRKDLTHLILSLEDAGKTVQIETNGSIEIPFHPEIDCSWIVDYKCPSSGMEKEMLPVPVFAEMCGNSSSLIKFVVDCSYNYQEDLKFVGDTIKKFLDREFYGYFAISPINADPKAVQHMVELIKDEEYRDSVIFSLQLHKLCGLP